MAADLRKACQLNLSSCYLNMGRNRDVVALCGEVLGQETGIRQALYRRGQAFAALGEPRKAVRDMEAAIAASPENEKGVIAEKLAAVRRKLPASPAEDDVEEVRPLCCAKPCDRPTTQSHCICQTCSLLEAGQPDLMPAPRYVKGSDAKVVVV